LFSPYGLGQRADKPHNMTIRTGFIVGHAEIIGKNSDDAICQGKLILTHFTPPAAMIMGLMVMATTTNPKTTANIILTPV
jgi:hypothetical protein